LILFELILNRLKPIPDDLVDKNNLNDLYLNLVKRSLVI